MIKLTLTNFNSVLYCTRTGLRAALTTACSTVGGFLRRFHSASHHHTGHFHGHCLPCVPCCHCWSPGSLPVCFAYYEAPRYPCPTRPSTQSRTGQNQKVQAHVNTRHHHHHHHQVQQEKEITASDARSICRMGQRTHVWCRVVCCVS